LAFAGLWEHWSGPAGEEITTCTIITTAANQLMSSLHHRMPVILGPEHFDPWLDPALQDTQPLQVLLKPCPDDWLTAYPVSTFVNNSRNEGSRCREPIGPAISAD
jgi:putative SOS response-associated peptidase YedK